MSCFPIFQLRLSNACQFESTRCRGSEWLAPICANPDTSITGSPESADPDPEQSAVEVAAHNPIELGWKAASCGKNPSANRFQPRRASFSIVGERIRTYDNDTSCTRVGVF